MTHKKRLLNAGLIAISVVYAVVLVKIILLKYGWTTELRSLQLVPFYFVHELIRPMTSLGVALKNVLGNLALFIPLGILLPAIFEKLGFWKTVLLGFLTSLGFELMQFIVGLGAADIDDLILNTLGCLLGAGLYFGLFLRKAKFLRAKLVSLVFLVVFGCCGVLALWLFAPNMLPAQIEVQNPDALDGLDRESYDASACLTNMDGQTLYLRADSIIVNSDAPPPEAHCPLAEDARIILERHSYRFSPNGNIQKTFVQYEQADAAMAAAALSNQQEGAFCDLWLDADGLCYMLVVILL